MDQRNVAVVLDANDALELRVSKTEWGDQGGSAHGVYVAMHFAISVKMCEGRCDWDHLQRGKLRMPRQRASKER